MLRAVLSDGTAVNIVRRGDDVLVGDKPLVTVVDDAGVSHGIMAYPVVPNGQGEKAFSIADGVISAVDAQYGSGLGIEICAFDNESPATNCPEVLRWLCDNYGLTFNPAGLYLCDDEGQAISPAITGFSCWRQYDVFQMEGTEGDDYCLLFPSDDIVLGCDGSQVYQVNNSNVISRPLQAITSPDAVTVGGAYNTWLFYLASGLPKKVFDDVLY